MLVEVEAFDKLLLAWNIAVAWSDEEFGVGMGFENGGHGLYEIMYTFIFPHATIVEEDFLVLVVVFFF